MKIGSVENTTIPLNKNSQVFVHVSGPTEPKKNEILQYTKNL
jgi:hypothetical protein